MFRRRDKRTPSPGSSGAGGAPPAAPPAVAPSVQDEALVDALAAVLRAFGDLAFDLVDQEAAEIREAFEGWARHALVGAPRPGLDRADAPGSGGARDWPGLARFAAEHRRRESDYVARSLADLRQVIWVFIQGVARNVTEDAASDHTISHRLGELRRSIDQNDTAALKREALSSISLIEEVIAKRKERQESQLQALSGRIDDIREELARAREQLEKDDLTGVYARGALEEYVERIVNLGIVSGRTATLYMVDCDDFKWVNDRFGHAAGDDVLRALAGCLGSVFRRASDFVGRFGGDEFAVIIPDGKLEQIHALGDALLQAVRETTVDPEGSAIRVTVSVGAARLVPGENPRRWLERADAALYAAKQGGRDRLVVADVAEPDSEEAGHA